jgi:TonB family protein
MIASWMVYGTAIALLLGLAALVAEQALERWGRAGRWAWVASLGGVFVVPVVAAGRLAVPGASTAMEVSFGEVVPLSVVGAQGGAAVGLPGAAALIPGEATLLGLWVLGSLSVLAFLLASHFALRGSRRGWAKAELEGTPVYLSEATGPAVVGFLRSEIVLPEWAVRMEARERRLMIAHEAEHVRAGDPWLLFAAMCALVVLPWNAAVWWQVRRLREAIEIDCDRRVLRRWGNLRDYGALLLEVGRRGSSSPLAVAALTPRATQLERRVRIMTRTTDRTRWVAGIAGSVLAPVLLLAACQLERPALPGPATPAVTASQAGPVPSTAALEPQTPLGVEGRAPIRQGGSEPADTPSVPRPAIIVDGVVVSRPGEADADDATGAAVPRAPEVRFAPMIREVLPVDTPTVAAEPTFTPFDVRPELQNRQDFVAAIERSYPPMLKDAGIGGTVVLWVFIDETGRVGATRLVQSSGYEQLDAVAQRLMAEVARFSPARNRGEPVPVWIQMPVSFATR